MAAADDTPLSAHCPGCGTRFRLSTVQLGAAEGLVRCGICMQIFDATVSSAEITAPTENAIVSDGPDHADLVEKDVPLVEQANEVVIDAAELTEIEETPEQGATSDNAVTTEIHGEGDEPNDIPALDSDDILDKLSSIDPDFAPPPAPRAPRRWPWFIASVAALIALVVQLAPAYPEHWQHTALGQRATALCADAGLPCFAVTTLTRPQPNNELITQNLLVRAHPDRDDALVVDALLLNKGPQKSSFPRLVLRFRDMNNREIASRIFYPHEYLAGELADASDAGLTVGQPVHVALAILDPGDEAVNYSLKLIP